MCLALPTSSRPTETRLTDFKKGEEDCVEAMLACFHPGRIGHPKPIDRIYLERPNVSEIERLMYIDIIEA